MGEDFEIEASCPKCGSKNVDSQWDDLGLVRIYFHCKRCLYLEMRNDGHSEDEEPAEDWQTDPDSWQT